MLFALFAACKHLDFIHSQIRVVDNSEFSESSESFIIDESFYCSHFLCIVEKAFARWVALETWPTQFYIQGSTELISRMWFALFSVFREPASRPWLMWIVVWLIRYDYEYLQWEWLDLGWMRAIDSSTLAVGLYGPTSSSLILVGVLFEPLCYFGLSWNSPYTTWLVNVGRWVSWPKVTIRSRAYELSTSLGLLLAGVRSSFPEFDIGKLGLDVSLRFIWCFNYYRIVSYSCL